MKQSNTCITVGYKSVQIGAVTVTLCTAIVAVLNVKEFDSGVGFVVVFGSSMGPLGRKATQTPLMTAIYHPAL